MGHKSRLFTLCNRLHLTVLMVTAMDNKDLVLGRNIIDEINIKDPFKCTLSGLDVIKGTVEAARVLRIAKVEPNKELDRLSTELRGEILVKWTH